MSTKDNLPQLDPGESTLPRKRFMNLHMEANVYEQATNLMPPEPPLPSPEPAPTVAEPVISWLAGWLDSIPVLKIGSSIVTGPDSTVGNAPSTKKNLHPLAYENAIKCC